jgi:protein TonB
VDETGVALMPRITDSTEPVCDESARRAVPRWRFEPGRKDGRGVRFRMAVPGAFSRSAE